MAIITRIRERSGLAVGVIAVGLILFLVGSDLLSTNSSILGGNQQVVGEIDGKEIPLEDYLKKVEEVKNRYAVSLGRQPQEQEMDYIRNESWNELVYETAFQKEFDRLGLEVSKEELKDMVQGNNIHPAIAQRFTNPQTGMIDRQLIVAYLQNIQKAPVEEQIQFYSFEQMLPVQRLREKYTNLLTFSNYVTNLEAKAEYTNQNTRATARYVFVPYTAIADKDIKPTDDQLKAYFSENKADFKKEANRSIEYVAFPLQPSAQDTAAVQKEVTELVSQFEQTEDDTAFVNANNEGPKAFMTYRPAEIPEQLKGLSLEKGKVYGSFKAGNRFIIYKYLGQKEDTVAFAQASHILFEVKEGDDKEQKRQDALKILEEVKNGADFGAMAYRYNSDATRNTSGDLGYFKDGDMVKPFNAAVMSAKQEGILPNIVETEFGFHIIKVTALPSKVKHQVAIIAKEITASEQTREASYALAGKFAEAQDVEEYVKAVKATPGTISLQALKVAKDARYINNLEGYKVREIVKWAYNAKLGEVSDVFELDQYYIVAILKGATEDGEASLEDVKEEVRTAVIKDMKAKTIMDKIGSQKDIDAIGKIFGADALVETDNFSFQSNILKGVGSATLVIGEAFGMKKGEKTGLIKEASGVVLLELQSIDQASEIADYSAYKEKLSAARNNLVDVKALKAIKKLANVKEELAKYY